MAVWVASPPRMGRNTPKRIRSNTTRERMVGFRVAALFLHRTSHIKHHQQRVSGRFLGRRPLLQTHRREKSRSRVSQSSSRPEEVDGSGSEDSARAHNTSTDTEEMDSCVPCVFMVTVNAYTKKGGTHRGGRGATGPRTT